MEAQQQSPTKHYTKEEYFALLEDSLHKYEYLDGQLRMMAGGTRSHADIIDNTFVALRTADHGCKVMSGETAISINTDNRYYFPDISAVCKKESIYETGGGIARITNPALIVEVISKGTGDYDRGEKFVSYQQLPSFREYILIDSRKCSILTYYRETNGLWRIGNYYRLDQMLPVYTLDVEISLASIYAGIDLPEVDD